MICFCAERFHWRRIWQNPGELLIPGSADMATRALLFRRPYEPSTVRRAADKGAREWPCLRFRGLEVRPDSAISAASEIAQRKNKSFAQYTGADRLSGPIGWAWNKKFRAESGLLRPFKD